jgi:hypothetical protein
VDHVVLCSAGWVSIMVYNAESVVVNQVYYSEPVVVNHGVLC